MSLTFLGGGLGGQILVDGYTLCMGELLEEMWKMVTSGELELSI